MAFVWRDDNSLTTYRHELPNEEQSKLTSIILKMRSKYVLHTESMIDIDPIDIESNVKSPHKRGSKKRKSTATTTTTNEIVPIINLAQLKAYFTKGKIEE